jgi:hypothetical protein
MPNHMRVTCSCGTELRVREDQEGSVIRCWKCHAEVPVPSRARERLAKGSVETARRVFRAEAVDQLMWGALVVTGVLALPRVGGWLSLVSLGFAGAWYRGVLQGRSRLALADEEAGEGPRWRAWSQTWAVGLAVGLGWIAPFLLRHVLLGRSGRFATWGGPVIWAVAVLAWAGVPLAVMATSAHDRSGMAGPRWSLQAVRRHPVATVVALLLVPLGLALAEVVVVGGAWFVSWLPCFVLDLFPSYWTNPPGSIHFENFESIDTVLSNSRLFQIYAQGVRDGYTLVGAIPASLPLGFRTWLRLLGPSWVPWLYLLIRALVSLTLLGWAGALLALQARWLGLIASVDVPRPKPSPSAV